MLEQAKKLGFVSLGFSGHGYQGFDEEYSMSPETQQEYINTVRALREVTCSDRSAPRIWLGVEEDSLTPTAQKEKNRRDMDYVIVSTHYFTTDFEGEPLYVDGFPRRIHEYVRKQLDGDYMAMVQEYYDLHVSALLASERVDIIGHFDLIRKYAASHDLFDENSPEYRRIALDALERAFPCGGIREINTGAMARGYLDTPYPTRELLGAWHEMGGRITITSDCHFADKLDHAYKDAIELAKACGFTSAIMLGTGDDLFDEVTL
ncbi:MAG: hypothetical protein E7554_09865 [Ruminococcaceae bacterium]|nr:hypothetical protein [Oscillospiraceae bacterium]